MVLLVAVPIALWLAAWLAMPGRPLQGNEVAELVYSRLLGRQQRVVLLALVVTLGAFLAGIAALPRHGQRSPQARTAMHQVCSTVSVYPQTCYTEQPGGDWSVETLQSNDTWMKVATMPRPPSPADLAMGYHG